MIPATLLGTAALFNGYPARWYITGILAGESDQPVHVRLPRSLLDQCLFFTGHAAGYELWADRQVARGAN